MPLKRTTRKSKKVNEGVRNAKAAPLQRDPARCGAKVRKTPSGVVVEPVVVEEPVVVKEVKEFVPAVEEPIIAEPAVTGSLVCEKEKKSMRVFLAAAILIIIIVVVFFLAARNFKNGNFGHKIKPQVVITDTFVPIDLVAVSGADAISLSSAKEGMPIDPSKFSEDFVVPNVKLTVKGSYALALPLAQSWSADAKLEFVKSIGTVTGEGKSTEWVVVFGSKVKKAGYQVVVWADQVASQKQVESSLPGHDLPENWFDSSGAVESFVALPQFATATVSGLNFFFNNDSNGWMYGINTSRGVTGVGMK